MIFADERERNGIFLLNLHCIVEKRERRYIMNSPLRQQF